jgi:LysR family hydrogen peroxide-inducible transcriptional activator
MEFHQLRYFVAVADEGSFSRAAVRERVAQPSLSQQVQKLESEMGHVLFDRLPRGVILTRAGEQLLVHAKRILAEAADARKALTNGGTQVALSLTLGVIPTIAPFLLPPLADLFMARHPRAMLEVVEDVTAGLLRRLDVGELDLAVVSVAGPAPSIQLEPLGHENLLVLLGPTSRLAAKVRLSWRDLARERFLVLHEMHCLSGQVAQVCTQHRVRPRVVFKGAQLDTMARMVKAGVGISIVPAMMAAADDDAGRVYRPLREPQPTRELNLAWNQHRLRSRPALELARAVRDVLGSAHSIRGCAPPPATQGPQ